MANHNQPQKRNRFCFVGSRMNKNPGLLLKSGSRVGLGQQRGAAIRQKTKTESRYFWGGCSPKQPSRPAP
jgi:hypothetical protein